MSIDFSGGQNARARIASALVPTAPSTVLGYIKQFSRHTSGLVYGIVECDVQGSNGTYLRLRIGGDGSLGHENRISVGARLNSGISEWAVNTGDELLFNIWQPFAGVFVLNSERHAYLEGGNKGTNLVSVIPTGLNVTYFGRAQNTSPDTDRNLNGRLAGVCIWNIALSDVQIAMHASGISPLSIEPANIVAYYPGSVIVSGPDTYMEDVSGNEHHAILENGAVWSDDNPTITSLVLNSVKNAPLTHTELDGNISYIDTKHERTVNTTIDSASTLSKLTISADITIPAPTGTPVDGQLMQLKLSSSASYTLFWDVTYRFFKTAPTNINGDIYLAMVYNAADVKWDVLEVIGV
jgi:hypothetical protein